MKIHNHYHNLIKHLAVSLFTASLWFNASPLMADPGQRRVHLQAETINTGDSQIQARARQLRADHLAGRQRSSQTHSRKRNTMPYLIQATDKITKEWKEQIRAAGAKIKGYIPDDTIIIEVTPEALQKIMADVPYAWIGEFQPTYKKSPHVRQFQTGAAVQSVMAGGEATAVFSVIGFDAADTDELAARIAALSGCVVEATESALDSAYIRARLTAGAIETITGWSEVKWIEPYITAKIDNNVAASLMTVRGSTTGNSENILGLTGAGEIVAVADSGLDTGNASTIHQDFTGRIAGYFGYVDRVTTKSRNDGYVYFNQNPAAGVWSDLNGHGTHVAGSVLGSGAASSGTFKGMAYEARLVMMAGGVDAGSSVAFPPTQYLFDAYNTGARIQTNSWGGNEAIINNIIVDISGDYDSSAHYIDATMWQYPDMLVLRSAGNKGANANKLDGRSLNPVAAAKNALTVGAANKNSPQGMATFSSRGPTSDNRNKPDIIAPGVGIYSTKSSLTGASKYEYMDGTSMSTPLTAGAATLVRQWLKRDQHITNPSAALVKAVLLAGAKTLYYSGQSTIPSGRPNKVEGWGHLDLSASLIPSAGGEILLSDADSFPENTSSGGNPVHTPFSFARVSASTPIRVMMVYTDYPGDYTAAQSEKKLVNDLDLTVITPSGGTLYPNGLTSADRRNNVEGIVIPAPAEGNYTVKVSASDVQHGPQRYALVIVGAKRASTTAPVITGISPSHGPVSGGNSVTITGTNLQNPSSVKFGNTDVTNTISNNTTTSLTVTAPAGTGSVSVSVTKGGETGASTYVYDVPLLNINTASWAVAASGASLEITLVAEAAWTLSSKPSWISATLSSGAATAGTSLTLTAASNSGGVRSGSIVFTSGGGTKTITVAQEADDSNAKIIAIPPTGGPSAEADGAFVNNNSSWTFDLSARPAWASQISFYHYEYYNYGAGLSGYSKAGVYLPDTMQSFSQKWSGTYYITDSASANTTGVSRSWMMRITMPAGIQNVKFVQNPSAASPVQPPKVTASKGTYGNKVSLSWNAVSGASYYEVSRSTTPTGSKERISSGWQSSRTLDDTNVVGGTTYYYWVRASASSSGSSPSDYSAWDAGYTSAAAPVTPAPVINSVTTAAGTVGSAFTYQITASNSPTSFSVTGHPSWLTFNSSTGLISGTPASPGTYVMTIKATNATGTGTTTLTLTVSSPSSGNAPANDNFASATNISGASGSVSGNNTNATIESGEPSIPAGLGGHSVWWKWTPASSGVVTINTLGSDFDTVLSVYTGASITSLTRVTYNDDYNNTPQSQVTFTATAGTTYYIAVDGYYALQYGSIVLNWSQQVVTTLANDNFASATPISGASGSVLGDNTNATRESNEPASPVGTGVHSVWWKWTPASSGAVTINTLGSDFDTVLSVYTGASITSLTRVIYSDDYDNTPQSQVSFNAMAGTTYYIAVDGYNASRYGSIVLNWNQQMTVIPPPANDNFVNAALITGNSGSVTGSNTYATKETGEPNHADRTLAGKSMWWKWIPATSGIVTIDTHESNFDTILAVYTGATLSSLTERASNDDEDENSFLSRVSFDVVAGTTYYIAVAGYDSDSGSITLNWNWRQSGAVALPNLKFHTPGGTEPFVVATNSDAAVSGSTFTTADTLWLSYGFTNDGPVTVPTAPAWAASRSINGGTPVTTGAIFGGVEPGVRYFYSGSTSNLAAGINLLRTVGTLSSGTYRIAMKLDSTGVVTESNKADNEAYKDITVVLATPASVTASKGTYTNKVEVKWPAVTQASGATYYQVSRSATPTGSKTVLNSTWATGTTYTDTSAVTGTNYYWVRAAANASGSYASGYSASDTGYVTAAPAPALTITPTSHSAAATASSLSVSVTSNVAWTVSSSAAWLTPSSSSGSNNGSVTVNYSANTSTSARTGTLTFSGGGLTKTVTVNQAGVSAALTVTPASHSAAATASSLSVSVASNVAWTVSKDAAWLTLSSSSGSNNGSLSVSVAVNTGAARTGTLTFSGGGLTRTVTVTQTAAANVPTLTVTPASKSVPATASTFSVSVASNMAWWYANGDVAWLVVSPFSGSDNGTLSVRVAANPSKEARTGMVSVISDGITRTVSVTQAGAVIQPPGDTWDLAGLSSKGVKLTAPAVPAGVKVKGKISYDWYKDGARIAGESKKTLTVKESGFYAVEMSYLTSKPTSEHMSTTHNFGVVKIFAQPKTVTLSLAQTTNTITDSALRGTSVVSGETLKLTASVGIVGGGAVGPFRYVWYSGSNVVRTQESTATTDTFTTPAYGDKTVGYKCVVELVAKDAKNKPLATAKSKDLKAKVILPPSAVTLSASAGTVGEGGTLTLSANAKGTAALTFNWYQNGKQIASGSAKKLAKKPVSASDAGTYYVVVTQDKTNRRVQSASVVVNIQRADGTTVSGAQSQSVPMAASPTESVSTTAATSSVEPQRQDAAGNLSNSASASVLNLAPLKLSAGDVLTVSGSATREYIIVNETQHSTGAYHYEWRDNLTAEFQDAEAAEVQLILHFITTDGGVYELSGSVGETGVFELRKK